MSVSSSATKKRGVGRRSGDARMPSCCQAVAKPSYLRKFRHAKPVRPRRAGWAASDVTMPSMGFRTLAAINPSGEASWVPRPYHSFALKDLQTKFAVNMDWGAKIMPAGTSSNSSHHPAARLSDSPAQACLAPNARLFACLQIRPERHERLRSLCAGR